MVLTKTDIELGIKQYCQWLNSQRKPDEPEVRLEDVFLYFYRNEGKDQVAMIEEWLPVEITDTAILLESSRNKADEEYELALFPLSIIDEIRFGA